MSKVRDYQKRHAALGLCIQCPSPELARHGRCFRHQTFYLLRKKGLAQGQLIPLNYKKREKLVAALLGRYHAITAGFLNPGDDDQRMKDAVEIRIRLKIRWGGVPGAKKLAQVMGTLDRHALRAKREAESGLVQAAG